MMPEMDGYEVCRRLREEQATRAIPIIFLTAKNETDDVVRGFELGAQDYVSKPFRPAELLARVQTHLTIRAQQREIAAQSTELKEMLQIVSHDVANHFSVVNMSLQLAAMQAPGSLEKYVPRITAAARNGIGLTNLVRDLRRAEEKGLALQPVALRDAWAEIVLLLADRISDKQLAVSVEVPDVSVVAENFALTNSVFGNVLSNAIKFSQAGGKIEVGGRVQGDMVGVTIRDHGVGMPPAVLDHLFDIGKGHSRKGTAGEKGTGFGMPLMRKFVTMFGGRVEVTTREASAHPSDPGTEFTIWLKRVAAPLPAG